MDKRIERKRLAPKLRAAIALVMASGVGVTLYAFSSTDFARQTQKISSRSVTTSKVIRGDFSESLSVRGVATARQTVYLDAIAGGVIDEKIVEAGTAVTKGQPLLRLSNTSLQLEVISREAQISEQQNFLRNNQLLAETSRLQLRTDILANRNQLEHLSRKVEQARPLVLQGLLPKTQLAELEEDLTYYKNRNRIALERQEQEERIRAEQLAQLRESATMLERSLAETRKVLDNLIVRAPVDGVLTELSVELGESKAPGSRLGRIDVAGGLKIVAELDEYYLSRIRLGMQATIIVDSERIQAQISKIDSRVNEGKFSAEINLPDESGAARFMGLGQSVDVDIMLSAGSKDSLMVERGAFMNDTGGNWIFVVAEEGTEAVRRPIKLGARNKDYNEVVSGLRAGETVITSSYATFDKAEKLYLN